MPEKCAVTQKFTRKLEDELSKVRPTKKLEEGVYLVNGEPDDFKGKKTLVLLPYCLKLVDCDYRVSYECDFTQEICSSCTYKKAFDALKDTTGYDAYEIISDSKDVPKAIKKFMDDHGQLEAVVAVACPRAIIEYDIGFIKDYDVPIILFMLGCWEECEPEKAIKGKFWGETMIDSDKIRRICSKCFGPLQKTSQQEE
jgi:mRNA-degrading endonuclease RelE of RelBE toxin-antitoxin system